MCPPSGWGQARLVHGLDMDRYCLLGSASGAAVPKCKIICTVGPNQNTVESLVRLIDAGMNVASLNFWHGDHETHGAMVKRVREASKQAGKPIAILLDIKGSEIRTGYLKDGGPVDLVAGDELKLVTDYTRMGDKTCIAVTYRKLCEAAKIGSTILIADGSLSLRVKAIFEDHVLTEVLNSCSLGERRNCSLPGVHVERGPVLQAEGRDDLLGFGLAHGVDFVAVSCVQRAEDVEFVRSELGSRGRSIRVISKIEDEEGVKNFESICKVSDGIMVARGHLGMEVAPENVFVLQKKMIAYCNITGKPVIIATQMLESMCHAPRPTRAEASDVANAVLDGTDCLMLCGETAVGSYALEAVTIARKICQTTEDILDYGFLCARTRRHTLEMCSMSPMEAVCLSAVKAAQDRQCKLIVAHTETGPTALALAKYQPQAPILAVTTNESTLRGLLISRGVVPHLMGTCLDIDIVVSHAITKAKDSGLVASGDWVVIVHGMDGENPQNSNLVRFEMVP